MLFVMRRDRNLNSGMSFTVPSCSQSFWRGRPSGLKVLADCML